MLKSERNRNACAARAWVPQAAGTEVKETMLSIKALYPVYCSGSAVSHICLSLCEYMRDVTCRLRLWTPACDPNGRAAFVQEAIPPILKSLAFKLDPRSRYIARVLQARYLKDFRKGDTAYLWPATPLSLYRVLKDRGATIVSERINTHRATSKRILDDAYRRQGWPVTHAITQAALEQENEKMALSDFVYSPSPLVAQSLVQAGVPKDKILQGTYGWSPERILGRSEKALPPVDGITMVFVGRIGIRKGAHLLLDYWAKAGIKGRLVLAGRVEAEFAKYCPGALDRPDVVHPGFNSDIGAIYRSADAFVFPSLEEGSPLVIYEAMACGLPVAVSPMGAGGIARDGLDGFVIDPYDEDRWVQTLRRLAAEAELRRQFGQSGSEHVQNFTWAKAGARRRELLQTALAAK